MLAVIAAIESSSRVVLRLRHQVVKDHLAHHPPPPVEHPRAHNHPPRRVQLASFSRISPSEVPPSEHDHEVDRLIALRASRCAAARSGPADIAVEPGDQAIALETEQRVGRRQAFLPAPTLTLNLNIVTYQ